MFVRWVSIRQAKKFVAEYHRHLPRVAGAIVCVGLWDRGQLRGVAFLSRGARLDGSEVVWVSRVCTDGVRNGCSMLYSRAKRIGEALGFRVVRTFTRSDESGASLRAVGAVAQGVTDSRSWSRACRSRSEEGAGSAVRWQL